VKPRLAFVVPGHPVPCARPRAVPVMGRGGVAVLQDGRPLLRAYIPPETSDYERHVTDFARVALAAHPQWSPVALSPSVRFRVSIHFVRTGGQGDLDNFAKSVLDGIKKVNAYRLDPNRMVRGKPAKIFVSGIFRDDRLIMQLLLSQHVHPKAEPRAEILVETAPAELTEPLWMRVALDAGWRPPELSP